ncbi:MAG: phosphatase PAP2 family protein [Elusimicrobia bacterium]|nr:phosphatase PAP2 family protein [Elusimicrobiota bacterium]
MRWDTTRWSLARFVEFAAALAGLAVALALNFWLGRLASRNGARAHTSPDLLLSLLPIIDLRALFIYGFALFLVALIVIGLARERHRLAHIVWLYAILISLRSIFIILTPMHEPAGALPMVGDPLFDAVGRYLTFRNDLFFSSHTSLPFLAYLTYSDRWSRRLFLAFSLTMAMTVLLTRQHYSIDVFAAFFITYAIYRWERRWMRAPYRRLRSRLLGFLLRQS